MRKPTSHKRIDLEIVDDFVNEVLNYLSEGLASNIKKLQRDVKNKKHLTYGHGDPKGEFIEKSLRMASSLLDEVAYSFLDAGYFVVTLKYKLIGDGMVGTSEGLFKPVFEIGLTVDPILGLPYYPGSTIKGAVRDFLETLIEEEGDAKDESCSLSDILFGNEESVGLVVFSDMYPIGCERNICSIYKKLVITPHYFSGGRPVDTEVDVKPNPLKFIGIEEGTVFKLIIALNGKSERFRDLNNCSLSGLATKLGLNKNNFSHDFETVNILQFILQLVAMLTTITLRIGIAAKASKGYNAFELVRGPDNCFQRFRLMGYEFPL